MPFIRGRRCSGAPAAILAALVLAAAPAAARADCPGDGPATKVFGALGDPASYVLLSHGDFESGADGWALDGSTIGDGNETAKVHGAADAKSLSIKSNGQAVSPQFCIDILHPSFRFFAKRSGSPTLGALNVAMRFADASGQARDVPLGALPALGYGTWQATPWLPLGITLLLWQPHGTLDVRLVFTPAGSSAWSIDDVYVDPYSR